MIDFFKKTAMTAISRTKRGFVKYNNERELNNYLHSDRRPWRRGYNLYKNKYLEGILNDPAILNKFLISQKLPENYGYRLDARVVEIPWVLAHLNDRKGLLLDAGSSLNNDIVLSSPPLKNKRISIITLAPESQSYWNLGISYLFGDLRNLDFRDNLFDSIACISTIEHVGMDNTMYMKNKLSDSGKNKHDFLSAIKEIKRVLKPGGHFYCTFPFGEYEDHGWFQQFDSLLADQLITGFNPKEHNEAVFRYDADGWKISDRASCAHCQFFDVHTSKYFDSTSTIDFPPDYPAGERAVLCLELIK